MSALNRGFATVAGWLMILAPLSAVAVDPALAVQAEPGPEDGGLRLRLFAQPRPAGDKEGFDVRIELVNTSDREVTLVAGWRNDDTSGVPDYLEAATSIECVPAVAPWIGGVQQGQRTSPQPQQMLRAGETMSVRWQTEGRQLKNRVTNPNEVQNPAFPFPGLYSVHATLDVITSERTVRLRSNEQLVPVGGSRAAPKHTYGSLWSIDREQKTAVLGLGGLQKIEPGDQFEIGSPKAMHWKLNITDVKPTYSLGTLELLTRSTYAPFREPPSQYAPANLLREKTPAK